MKSFLSIFALVTSFALWATPDTVIVTSNQFIPQVLTVEQGDTVVFQNINGSHNVNGTQATYPNNPASFGNGVAPAPWTYQHIFTVPGTYDYQCDPHIPGMVGQIIVQSAYPAYPIATVVTNDANGEPDSLGVQCALTGTVFTIDYDGNSGLSFYIHDGTEGINAFNFSDVDVNGSPYAPAIGDNVTLYGDIDFYNGLTEIFIDSIVVNSTGNSIQTPTVVTALDETTESELVRLNNVTIVDPSDWPTSATQSRNVDVTDGTNTYTVRITNATDIYANVPLPTTSFDVVGVGGQFDFSSPYFSGYQLIPGSSADFFITAPTTAQATFNPASLSVVESAGTVTVNIDIAFPSTSAESMDVTITEGMGIMASDYSTTPAATAGTFTLNIPANATSASFDVTINDDSDIEMTETLTFALSNFSSGISGGIDTVFTLDIADNDNLATPCNDLFFSEYIEGSSSNKAVEIYNPTSSPINLGDYTVALFSNGSTTFNNSFTGTGIMIPAGGTYVIANSNANASILAAADTTSNITFFNGDDAVALIYNPTADTIDVIGVVGTDPGSSWTVDTGSTQNYTLVRKIDVQAGTPDWALGATQWDVYPQDVSTDLGMHSMNPCGTTGGTTCTELFFSEYIEGSSNNKGIEIYNPTSSAIDLSDYEVLQYSNGGTTPNNTLVPQGMIAAGGTFVITNSNADPAMLAVSDTNSSVTFYNGDDAIALVNTVTGDTIDIIGEIGIDPGSSWTVGTGSTQDYTLVRNINVQSGNTDWSVASTEWDVYPVNTFTFLGSHTMNPCGASNTPIVNFQGAVIDVLESVGTTTVDVTIANPDMNNATTVDIAVDASSTASSADYSISPTTVTFPAGSSAAQTVTVTIVNDVDIENDETIVLQLQNASTGAIVGANDQYTITILDDDTPIPTYTIGQIDGVDANGVADSSGVYCKLEGIIVGTNLRPSGIQITLWDGTGGIQIFSFNGLSNISNWNEGDQYRVIGTVSQFNGLLQFEPDSAEAISGSYTLPTPAVVTSLDESTESHLVRLNGVTLVDPNDWTNSGSGFNVDVTDGTNTYTVRIDADVDVYGQPAPVGQFDIIGVGGQFDSSSPYDEGYQLFPRYQLDIIGAPVAVANVFINEIMANNNSTAQDNNGDFDDWIELYNGGLATANLAGHYLTNDASDLTKYQIPTGITTASIPSTGFILVWADNEDFEGDLHTNFELDETGGFVALVAPDGTTIIDSMSYGALAMDQSFGRQPDGSQNVGIFPAGGATPDATNNFISVVESENSSIRVYPNPASDFVYIDWTGSEQVQYNVIDMFGRTIFSAELNASNNRVDLSSLSSGVYTIQMVVAGQLEQVRVIIQ